MVFKSGDHMESKKILSDEVMLAKRHGRGGQSQKRFERLANQSEAHYITKLGELIIRSFMTNNNTEYLIEKLIIVGPSYKKKLLADNSLVQQYFHDKIQLVTTSVLNDQTIYEIINQSRSIFDTQRQEQETKIIEEINDFVITNPDILVFGQDEINEGYQNHELQKVIINDKDTDLELKENDVCQIIRMSSNKLNELGFNYVGIKWY